MGRVAQIHPFPRISLLLSPVGNVGSETARMDQTLGVVTGLEMDLKTKTFSIYAIVEFKIKQGNYKGSNPLRLISILCGSILAHSDKVVVRWSILRHKLLVGALARIQSCQSKMTISQNFPSLLPISPIIKPIFFASPGQLLPVSKTGRRVSG